MSIRKRQKCCVLQHRYIRLQWGFFFFCSFFSFISFVDRLKPTSKKLAEEISEQSIPEIVSVIVDGFDRLTWEMDCDDPNTFRDSVNMEDCWEWGDDKSDEDLLADGIDIDTIARRLGHENSKITREIYLHVTKKAGKSTLFRPFHTL